MTVKDLIERLQKEDPARLVVMSRDSEGNSYSPLHSLYTASYSDHDGETGLEKLTPELEKEGYTEEDVLEGQAAVVLYPED